MSIRRAKVQYDCFKKYNIERCNEKKFNIYTSVNGKEETKYMEYGGSFYKVNFIEETDNVIVDEWIHLEKRNKIISSSEKKSYEYDEIVKIYNWLNFNSFNYVKKNRIIIQNMDGGTYYNPTITLEDKVAIIKSGNKIISKVRDMRNIALLKSINKEKDLVYVSANYLYINSLKVIDRDDTPLNITIYEDDDKKYNRIARNISIGSCINDEKWLFLIEDRSNDVEGSMLLKLPDGNYYNCNLEGNELKIKNIDKRRNLKGIAFALVRKKVNIVHKKETEVEQVDERENFVHLTSSFYKNNSFIKLMSKYMNIERDMLEQAYNECNKLKYVSLEKNKFVIHENSCAELEKWSKRIGVTVMSGKSLLGTLDEVGENYIKVNFFDDMKRNSISRNSGTLAISLRGDEIVQARREKAISILENSSSANCNLGEILGEKYSFNDYKNINKIKKHEIGRLVEKQLKAIEGSLNSPDIYLIQGPPGTGKTTVIRRIVNEIINNKEEVLVTSYQNMAVDNVLDGFLKEDIIPFRFGTEDNFIMNKICEEIVTEINSSLNNNISVEKDKELEKFKEKFEELRHKIWSENEKEMINVIEETIELIKKYEGMSSNFSKMRDIHEELKKELQSQGHQFDRDSIIAMFPKEYGFEIEVTEMLSEVESYLNTLNRELKSKTIENIILEVKNLQDMDTLFSLSDKEYQNRKKRIYDEMKLIKSSDNNEVDCFSYQLNVSVILDNIVENMPMFIENDKYIVAKRFNEKINKNPILLEEILNKYPDVRGTTCQKTVNSKFLNATRGIDYDYVIVDEAARANPLDLIIPLVKGKKVILVGDHKQLPHMLEDYVESQFKDDEEVNYDDFKEYIEQSLFGRLFKNLPDSRKIMLDTQYRMNREIGDLVSELFYNNKLNTGTDIVNDTQLYTGNSLVYLDVKGKQIRTNSGSLVNKVEAKEIVSKLLELNELSKDQQGDKITVGIISFYKAQVEYLRDKIRTLNLNNIDVKVGTVDAYQGLEKDVIFLSAVRTKGVGFTANPNRLNVSLSRAKKLVVLFGDIRNLTSDKLFKKIIQECKDGRNI